MFMAERNRCPGFCPLAVGLERENMNIVVNSSADVKGLAVRIECDPNIGVGQGEHLLLRWRAAADIVHKHILLRCSRNQAPRTVVEIIVPGGQDEESLAIGTLG